MNCISHFTRVYGPFGSIRETNLKLEERLNWGFRDQAPSSPLRMGVCVRILDYNRDGRVRL